MRHYSNPSEIKSAGTPKTRAISLTVNFRTAASLSIENSHLLRAATERHRQPNGERQIVFAQLLQEFDLPRLQRTDSYLAKGDQLPFPVPGA